MSRYWSELARGLQPYVPGEQPRVPGLVKLNTNESSSAPSPRVLDALRAAATDDLRLYPDPRSDRLRGVLADYHGVEADQVFVGNGSDEVLAHAFAALLKRPEPLLLADVTYVFYRSYCRLFGVASEEIPLDADMRVDLSPYLDRGGPVILPNPNAPTGIALPRGEIARLVRGRGDAPVVIDEAYVDFGAETAVPLIADCPNLLVVRSFSKSRSLAGLRVGYALGDRDLIAGLTRVKDSFNSYPLGRLAQAGAVASIEDEPHFRDATAAVVRDRALLAESLGRLGFAVLPSCANFVFARHPGHDAAALAAALRERAVLVRHFAGPRVSEFLRIGVGSAREIGRLLDALAEVLSSGPPRGGGR